MHTRKHHHHFKLVFIGIITTVIPGPCTQYIHRTFPSPADRDMKPIPMTRCIRVTAPTWPRNRTSNHLPGKSKDQTRFAAAKQEKCPATSVPGAHESDTSARSRRGRSVWVGPRRRGRSGSLAQSDGVTPPRSRPSAEGAERLFIRACGHGALPPLI